MHGDDRHVMERSQEGLGAVVRCCLHAKIWIDVEICGKLMNGLERSHKVIFGHRRSQEG